MKSIIVASNNDHKIKEIKQILSDINVEVKSLKDCNIDIDVVEDGKTFLENSYKKASEIYEYAKEEGMQDFLIMADDSGLEVDYLNGEPGVYSARYAGEHGNNKKNNEKLLEKLKGVPTEKRNASFVCAIVLINSDGKTVKVEERAYGVIKEELSGVEGFGYDPLFFVPEFNKTFAEMTADEKNSISHRGKALDVVKKELNNLI
ncbi:non-canonical purine NTP pyrophosphatase [Clostridium zeae]|uniref:dITP/XTP pyrophosphatase n=1 Tax=Clostridium zeae TaxID=2759022 RepID=A0ABQ1ECH3_9CLOT|nr:XTP/dITP diphosphatase [Clostridium zeae]GFZ32472.1 non-canonical purine NTP pyrophosphatase [Clostridium zeae]